MTQKETVSKIFDFLEISEKLKTTKRYLNTKEMKQKESSADHSWNLAMLAVIVGSEFDLKIDLLHALKIALVHDLPEAIAGDTDHSLIAWGIKTPKEKTDKETAAMKKISKTLPSKSGQDIYNLWSEYEEAASPEARFVKALDKIEGIDHMLCRGHESFDHPDLVAKYPLKTVRSFPEMEPLLEELQKRLKPKYKKKNWEWKKEYDI